MKALEARGLTKRYGGARPAVDRLSLTLHDGEVVALVGESGSGKSTTARMLVGVTPATHGHVALDGRILGPARTRQDRRLIQLVTQNPRAALNRRRSVRHALTQALRVHDLAPTRDEATARIDGALGAVGLQPVHLDRRPQALSGGELARATLARALLLSPRFLVLDELTTSLDASTKAKMVDLLRGLCATTGVGVLLITHELSIARRLASRTAVMHQGVIVEEGSTEAVLEAPRDPYARELVASVALTELRGGTRLRTPRR